MGNHFYINQLLAGPRPATEHMPGFHGIPRLLPSYVNMRNQHTNYATTP